MGEPSLELTPQTAALAGAADALDSAGLEHWFFGGWAVDLWVGRLTRAHDDIDVLVGVVEEIAESGDFSAFDTPEAETAGDNAHAFDLENCGWGTADVTAADYEFQGIDASYDAGIVSFEVEGVHPHDVGTILDDEGVAIRAGHHCAQPLMQLLGVPATCRASFAAHSDSDDIEALVAGLKKVKRIFG